MARRRQLGYALCWILILAWPARGATQAFFTSQESVEAEVVRLIDQSRISIDMALFELRSPRLAQAVEDAQKRGVLVHTVLDASHKQGDLPAGEVRWLGGKNSGGHGVMHHKFALFDQERVVTGSFNWTPSAEHANYENALLIDDADTVKSYAQEFENLWRRAAQGPPPTGTTDTGGKSSRRSKHRASFMHETFKTFKIKVWQPVRNCRHKTHTNRP